MNYLPEEYEDWTEEEKRKFLVDELEKVGEDPDDILDLETEELEEMYNVEMDALDSIEDSMYPNGRDYDAENWD